MESAAIRGALFVLVKALSPLSGGLVEAWAATSGLGPNVEALKTELLYAQAMLDNARGREIRSHALAELLQKLRALAYGADDVLDELDYFRIQDELDGTFEAVDHDDRGCVHNLVRDVCHTAKAATKLLGCGSCYSAAGDTYKPEESCMCVRRLASHTRTTVHDFGKRLLCSSHLSVRDDSKHAPRVPKLKFDRVDVSTRMKCITDELKPLCAKVSTILGLELSGSVITELRLLGSSGIGNVASKSRPITTSQALEHTLYGREPQKNTIIEHIINDEYIHEKLTVIPIVGPGGIGKTTLTQYIYNNKEVQDHFKVRVWICVSLDFSVHKLTQEIVSSIPKAEDEKEKADSETLRIGGSNSMLQLPRRDAIWQLPVTSLTLWSRNFSGKEVTRLLTHLPELSNLRIYESEKITRLGVEAEQQQTAAALSLSASPASIELQDTHGEDEHQERMWGVEEEGVAEEVVLEPEEDDDGLLLLPASLQELFLDNCPELILTAKNDETGGGGGLQAMRSLKNIEIANCPKFLSAYMASDLSSCCPFPSSLQHLLLSDRMEGMDTLVLLSNLTSLENLSINHLGEDFRCEGLLHLLTQGQLTALQVWNTPELFADWDPAGELQGEQLLPFPKLQQLETDEVAGVLTAPICRLLSSSLTKLSFQSNEDECFTKEQEEALFLLTSLQDLEFMWCSKLRCLPAGLNKLPNLKRLEIYDWPAIRSLPKNGLPSSLQELVVGQCIKLWCLPAGLHRLTNLKTLRIAYCPAMRSLPKNGLPNSLQELDVRMLVLVAFYILCIYTSVVQGTYSEKVSRSHSKAGYLKNSEDLHYERLSPLPTETSPVHYRLSKVLFVIIKHFIMQRCIIPFTQSNADCGPICSGSEVSRNQGDGRNTDATLLLEINI
ncbi:putative disease resistance protein RGA4 [Hordeum vulgare]|nr:putative disease resistance protein RGA4 [Hordeum vulgare]